MSSENFASFFLKLCEEYDVTPLPKFVYVDSSTTITQAAALSRMAERGDTSSIIINKIKVPMIFLTFEAGSKESNLNVEKIECKGHEISVCMLDALGLTLEKFNTLTTIKLPNCRINAFGITQIAEMLGDVGCVRDLNLDMNPNIRENYYLLCAPKGKLCHLSLKYCNISDLGLEKIAKEIAKDHEASQLIGLNLSNNRITDVGAREIARMLHTNRSLQSLVLAANGISDVGASFIIRELCMYPLTHEEIVKFRRLNYTRLLQRDEKFDKTREPLISANSSKNSSRKNSKTSKTRKNNDDRMKLKENPRLNTEGRMIKGEIVAAGNFELQHLNLSYNRLTDESLQKIVQCIFYQSYTMLRDTSRGLLYVNLEGNNFRKEEDAKLMSELLRKRLTSQT